jgi:hypothetical protein
MLDYIVCRTCTGRQRPASLQSQAFDDSLCILAPAAGIKLGEITDEEIARFLKVWD